MYSCESLRIIKFILRIRHKLRRVDIIFLEFLYQKLYDKERGKEGSMKKCVEVKKFYVIAKF
jgi:hypothetical protein